MAAKFLRDTGFVLLYCVWVPFSALVRVTVVVILVCAVTPFASTAAAPDSAEDIGRPGRPDIPGRNPGMERAGPGDALTSPEERVRVDEERKAASPGPAAVERGMNNPGKRPGARNQRYLMR